MAACGHAEVAAPVSRGPKREAEPPHALGGRGDLAWDDCTHQQDEAVLVVRDDRLVQLVAVDDGRVVERSLLPIGAMLLHARQHAPRLSDVGLALVGEDIDHRSVDDTVTCQRDVLQMDASRVLLGHGAAHRKALSAAGRGEPGDRIDLRLGARGSFGRGGASNRPHSSVYFVALPREASTGYLVRLRAILSRMISRASRPVASAIKRQ